MSKIKLAVSALALTVAGIVNAMPLEAMIEEQRGAMVDEIAKKRAEIRAQTPGASPTGAAQATPVPARLAETSNIAGPTIDDIAVVAIYGEEGKLKADISVRNGMAVSRREGAEILPGWFVETINSQYVSFVKGRKKIKNAQRHIVYNTEPASNVTSQLRGIAQIPGIASPLPPMPALPPSLGGGVAGR